MVDPRAVDGEVLVGEQLVPVRVHHDGVEKGGRDIAIEQPIAILREGRRRPHGVINPKTDSMVLNAGAARCRILLTECEQSLIFLDILRV